MSNVIDFLERMGGDASLRGAGTDELARELAAAAVDGELATAILAGDDTALRNSVAPGKVFDIQLDPQKEEVPEEDEDEHDEEDSVRKAGRRGA
jgi:hypothetical protein